MNEQYPSGRFGGDMDRNEVEMDLNKFMAMVEEIGALKDKVRDLEDVKNNNPYQKVIFIVVGAGAAWFGLYAGTSGSSKSFKGEK